METNKEKQCCKMGGFEHQSGLEYTGKVCSCTCHKPFEPQVDKQQEIRDFNKNLAKVIEVSGLKMCIGCGLTPEGLDYFISQAIEQERESRRKELEGIRGEINLMRREFVGKLGDALIYTSFDGEKVCRKVLQIIDNKLNNHDNY